MLTKSDIARLIPQQGTMSLLERVVAWNEQGLTAVARSQTENSNPLRAENELPALTLCEYGAQAMAIHGALLAGGDQPTMGMLVSLRTVRFFRNQIHDLAGEITIIVDCIQRESAGAHYEFRALHGNELLASGRAIVALRLP